MESTQKGTFTFFLCLPRVPLRVRAVLIHLYRLVHCLISGTLRYLTTPSIESASILLVLPLGPLPSKIISNCNLVFPERHALVVHPNYNFLHSPFVRTNYSSMKFHFSRSDLDYMFLEGCLAFQSI